MWFCGNKLISNNICKLSIKNTSDLLFILAIVFSLLPGGLSVMCVPTYLVGMCLKKLYVCYVHLILFYLFLIIYKCNVPYCM